MPVFDGEPMTDGTISDQNDEINQSYRAAAMKVYSKRSHARRLAWVSRPAPLPGEQLGHLLTMPMRIVSL